ncbi:hypothetical protein NPIL_248151 [Nephila pilipes]|uniref:Uncharacterized protein n=1 Tax=Nephila pilipes TaxID=299642 RepID=A0A8X6PMM8_NEPPI|nr:hypothetical protein NPIL_248151 [Nephila pilipes]
MSLVHPALSIEIATSNCPEDRTGPKSPLRDRVIGSTLNPHPCSRAISSAKSWRGRHDLSALVTVPKDKVSGNPVSPNVTVVFSIFNFEKGYLAVKNIKEAKKDDRLETLVFL